MGQLHELLAVEDSLKKDRDSVKKELSQVFGSPALFEGATRKVEMFDEDRKNEECVEEKELTTTVKRCLEKGKDPFIKYWDARLQKEAANQEARADIIVDGVTLIMNAPVCWILNMEDELKELLAIYEKIPVLPPGVKWGKDTTQGDDVYRSGAVEKMRGEKQSEWVVVVKADQYHPAQIKEKVWTKNVGKYVDDMTSGMMSKAEKSGLFYRIKKLQRAFKKARSVANKQDVVFREAGEDIFRYINGD